MVPLWQVAVFGLALFAAYATIVVIALRKQKLRNDRKLGKVRKQRNRWRSYARWVEQQAVDVQFSEIVRAMAQRRGGGR
jgi:hypothetical protein